VANAGASFTKTWRFKNIGTTTWDGYKLWFKSGEKFSGPASVSISKTPPGKEVDISVNLKAPTSPTCAAKDKNGVWEIRDNKGTPVSGGTATVVITVNPTTGSPIPDLRKPSYNPKSLGGINPLASSGFGGQCTAFAWGRANELKGITTLPTGNAKDWWASTIFPGGQIAYPNAIPVWSKELGHVAYIEKVDGKNITLNEANFSCLDSTTNWGGGYDGAPKIVTTDKMLTRYGQLLGYIYLDPPVLTSISPTTGKKDTVVSITGGRFGDVKKSGFKVTFGSTEAPVQSWKDNNITVKAPNGSGTVDVKVTTTAGTSNSLKFTYK
jgi:surface antigen